MSTIEINIEKKIRGHFSSLEKLNIHNDSHKHGLGRDDSHFALLIVSSDFAGQGRLQRQQKINKLLEVELKIIHSLSLMCLTPEEFKAKNDKSDQSLERPKEAQCTKHK